MLGLSNAQARPPGKASASASLAEKVAFKMSFSISPPGSEGTPPGVGQRNGVAGPRSTPLSRVRRRIRNETPSSSPQILVRPRAPKLFNRYAPPLRVEDRIDQCGMPLQVRPLKNVRERDRRQADRAGDLRDPHAVRAQPREQPVKELQTEIEQPGTRAALEREPEDAAQVSTRARGTASLRKSDRSSAASAIQSGQRPACPAQRPLAVPQDRIGSSPSPRRRPEAAAEGRRSAPRPAPGQDSPASPDSFQTATSLLSPLARPVMSS